MNLHVASRAVGVLRVQIMLRTSRLHGSDVVRYAVACQTKLADSAEPQQPRMRRAMRRVTSRTPFSLKRRVFVGEWTLLISVTLNASCIRAGGQSGLLEFKTAMGIVAITALHGSFEDLMMERLCEIRLHFTMTTHAELRLADFQHVER
jgi:hypothetical protein